VPDESSSPRPRTQRVGPPVLLAQRPRFIERAVAAARLDERIRALLVWGSLARGDADEWSDVDLVMAVSDESVPEILEELSREDSAYGRSLITLQMPQNGVDKGGCVSVTYLQSGLPLHVNWYICPLSGGLPVRDTKPLFSHERWPEAGSTFAEILRDRPSRASNTPSELDLLVSMTPIHVNEVARGRPEVVLVDGKPATDRIDAYDELGRRIAELPSDVRAPFFYHLGLARRGR
jgi:hypothetical protein